MKTPLRIRRYARIYSLGYQAATRRYKAINEPEKGDKPTDRLSAVYWYLLAAVAVFAFALGVAV